MSEHGSFFNRLKGVFHREQQLEPTPEQIQTLHRMREILNTKGHPGMHALDVTEAWYEGMTRGSPQERLGLVNSLYQKVAGNPEVSFSKDFPSVARRFEESFKPQSRRVEDFSEIPDWSLNPFERLDKYVNEYLEDLQPPEVAREPSTPLLPPAQSMEPTE